jgi:hypothetical protein
VSRYKLKSLNRAMIENDAEQKIQRGNLVVDVDALSLL